MKLRTRGWLSMSSSTEAATWGVRRRPQAPRPVGSSSIGIHCDSTCAHMHSLASFSVQHGRPEGRGSLAETAWTPHSHTGKR